MRNHLSYSEFLARSSSTLISVRKELTLHEIREEFAIAKGVKRLIYIFPCIHSDPVLFSDNHERPQVAS